IVGHARPATNERVRSVRCSADLLPPSPPAEKATARQYQGPEVVVRKVRASSIRTIAIMTNAVGTNRIMGSPPSWCVTLPCLSELYGELDTTMTLAQSEPKSLCIELRRKPSPPPAPPQDTFPARPARR